MTAAEAPFTLTQQLELARVRAFADVVPDTVTFEMEDGEGVLSFDFRTEPTVEPPRADVREVERVRFRYRHGDRFGQVAPSYVICNRADFPRNVGHLCAGPPGSLAVPCLAIGGMQPIYERAGIEALLARLRDFMRDAKTGTLMAEGWEPVPYGLDEAFRLGEVIPGFFQEYAHAHPQQRYAYGVAITGDHDGSSHVNVFPQDLQLDQIPGAMGERNKPKAEGLSPIRRAVPWVFLWPEPSSGEPEPMFEAWRNLAELREGMRRIGVLEAYDAAVGALFNRGIDLRFACPPAGGQALVVVLGVWRPAPIMRGFFGYSADPEARRLELRAYMIRQPVTGQITDDKAKIESIVGNYPPRPELMRWVSGAEAMPKLAMLGVGALGSAILNSLVRAGAEDVVVQDKDMLLPHNLARHTGGIMDVFRLKTHHAESLIKHVVQGGSTTCVAFEDDIAATDLDTLRSRVAGRLVIDATADEPVRRRMDELRRKGAETLVRTEMFHEGRLGTTFVSRPGGPTFTEMMLSLIAQAISEPAVAAWLEYEAQHPFGPDPMLYGFGCTSQTVHLPNYAIEQQASVAVAAILDRTSPSGVGLNPLDDRYRPLGWHFVPVAPFASFTPPAAMDWTVCLSVDAQAFMESERAAALPAETGGYLYGSWDPVRKSITIVSATPMPPDSVSSPALLKLGSARQTSEEKRLLRKTRERLFMCGTWHSHPDGDARMSGRDDRTMQFHYERDAPMLRPTLIMIVAQGEIQAHLRVP